MAIIHSAEHEKTKPIKANMPTFDRKHEIRISKSETTTFNGIKVEKTKPIHRLVKWRKVLFDRGLSRHIGIWGTRKQSQIFVDLRGRAVRLNAENQWGGERTARTESWLFWSSN
jgi:hypothetical protein